MVSNRLPAVTNSTIQIVGTPGTDKASVHPPTQKLLTGSLPTPGGRVSFETKSFIVAPTTKYSLVNL